MSSDYTFRGDLQGLAYRDFLRARKFEKASSSREEFNTRVETAIKNRVSPIREKLQSHIIRNKHKWIAAEIKKIRERQERPERLSRASGPKPPYGANPSRHHYTQNQIVRRARSNVERRCFARLHKVDRIERKMIRKLTNDRSRTR